MTKTEALKKLNTLLKELSMLPYYDYNGDNSDFDKWKRKASRYIEEIFENKNGQSTEFCDIEFGPVLYGSVNHMEINSINVHKKGRVKAQALIESFIEEVNEWENSPEDNCLMKLNYFIRSAEILTLEDSFKRFGVNEDFDKFKLELEMFLKNTFGDTSDEFNKFKKIRFLYTGSRGMEGLQVPLDLSTYKDGLKSTKILLETILNNINENSLIKTQPTTTQIIPETKKTISNKVFIVHGHDELAIVQVSEVLRKLKLEPIILKDEASKSNTIIEKIERLSSDVGFGIVLYTACDIGGKDLDSLQPRARQNVVLEHGYLMAKLGRENTLALKKGNVETPSDIQGLVYTPMDEHKAWQYKLVDELKASGYNVSKDTI